MNLRTYLMIKRAATEDVITSTPFGDEMKQRLEDNAVRQKGYQDKVVQMVQDAAKEDVARTFAKSKDSPVIAPTHKELDNSKVNSSYGGEEFYKDQMRKAQDDAFKQRAKKERLAARAPYQAAATALGTVAGGGLGYLGGTGLSKLTGLADAEGDAAHYGDLALRLGGAGLGALGGGFGGYQLGHRIK